MNDLMVDIETMGTSPGSVIIQIGACYFDRIHGFNQQEHSTFIVNVSLTDSMNNGFTVDPNTIKWWMDQVENGNPMTWRTAPMSVLSSLQTFREFAADADCIWSHTNFDFVLLQEAFRKLGICSLPHRKARDIRTLLDLSGLKIDTKGKPHDALEDALYQVEYCVECFKKLKTL